LTRRREVTTGEIKEGKDKKSIKKVEIKGTQRSSTGNS
jgi:hypothetical protein